MRTSSDSVTNDCLQHLLSATGGGRWRLEYVIVANVDALLRYYQDSEFRRCFQSAEVVITAGRFSGWLVRWLSGIRAPVCSPESLLRRIRSLMRSTDRILWIGDANSLPREMHAPNVRCLHLEAGADALANVAACVSFVEVQAPFRFCLLAMGSPQRELIAHTLFRRARASGLVLCVGN
jgi:hypothetical protein